LHALFGSTFELEGQLSRTRFDAAFRAPSDPFGFTRSDTASEGRRARAVASWQSARDLKISWGGDFERLEVSNSSSFGSNLRGDHQRTWAAFAQASAPVGPLKKARLEAGLRRDDNDVYGQKTSLRAGTVVPLGGFVLRASYGESFRAPSLGELFFPGSGNSALEPEEGQSVEVGLERRLGSAGFSIVGFSNRQKNLIDFDPVTFRNVNVLRAKSQGLEGEVDARRGIASARLTATYLETEDRTTGLPLLRRPRRSASLLLTLAPKSWSTTLTGRYVGERADLDPVSFGRAINPSYLRFDLAARSQGFGRFEPYARVENLADREYEEALGFPAPGRTWIAGLAVSF
ncbi:MAG TPA: TonB-dependent receptor, partial [Thermoanaerobaculia bacterium]|nr:TonB-dependent receptor [Thermoanaerobaculia bacterium]